MVRLLLTIVLLLTIPTNALRGSRSLQDPTMIDLSATSTSSTASMTEQEMLDMPQEELATSSTMSAGSTEAGMVDAETTTYTTVTAAAQDEGLPEMTWEENENAPASENETISTSPSQSPSTASHDDIDELDEGSDTTLPSEPVMVTYPTEEGVVESPLDSPSNETGLDAESPEDIPTDPLGSMSNAPAGSPTGDELGVDADVTNPADVPEITDPLDTVSSAPSVSPPGLNADESGFDAETSSTTPNEVVGSTTEPIAGSSITDDEYGEGDDSIGEYNDDIKGENEGEGEPWYAEDDEFNDEAWSEDDEEFEEWEEEMGFTTNTEPTYPPTPRPTLAYESPSDDILQVETIAEFDDEITNVGEKVKEYMEGVESFEDMTKDSNVQVVAGVLSGIFLVLMMITAWQVMENPDGLCAR